MAPAAVELIQWDAAIWGFCQPDICALPSGRKYQQAIVSPQGLL